MSDDDQRRRNALKTVAATLQAAQVPYALSGGYAAWARGGPEPTHDVDFVLVESDVPQALKALENAGLDVQHPPEDWLEKVFVDEVLVDLIFRPSERPVTPEQLQQSDLLNVDSMVIPVLSATELLIGKLMALNEHFCDFTSLFLPVRALREQVDWHALTDETASSPFAQAFLRLAREIGIAP